MDKRPRNYGEDKEKEMIVKGSAEYRCEGCGKAAIGYDNVGPRGWGWMRVMHGAAYATKYITKDFCCLECAQKWISEAVTFNEG